LDNMSERKTVDLRKPKPSAAPAATDVFSVMGFANKNGAVPLLPQGTVIDASRLAPEERAALEAGGWQQGDPIPDLKAVLAEAQDMGLHTLPQTTKATIGKVVDINDLPESKRREIEAAVRAAKSSTQPAVLDPSVAPSVRAAAEQLQIIDTVEKPVQPAPAPASSPTGALGNMVCENCGWEHTPTSKPFHVTDEDKRNWLVAFRARTDFQKEYTAYAGAIKARFRTLRRDELRLAMLQTDYDIRDKKIPSNTYAFQTQFLEYQLCMSLTELFIDGRAIVWTPFQDVVPYTEDEDKKPQTQLELYLPLFMEKALPREADLRAVIVLFSNFNSTVLRLEANMMNADFWKGIA